MICIGGEHEDFHDANFAGKRGLALYVVESGGIAIVDETTEEPKLVHTHHRHEFSGDVSLLTDGPAVVSAYAEKPTRAVGHHSDHGCHWDPQATDTRHPAHLVGIYCDT